MTEQWLDKKPNCYIEFRVNDPERFETFQRFFSALRKWTLSLQDGSYADTTQVSRLPSMHERDTQEASQVEDTLSRRDFERPEDWMLAFRPKDLDVLGMPPHAESIIALRDWHGLTRGERRTQIKSRPNKQQLQVLADFADMIRYWQDVEYMLIECEMEFGVARVEYSTFDFPFNGKVALEELLMFFGFFSIVRDSC